MKLKKIRIGDIVVPFKEKCNIPNLTEWDISGINRDKEFFEPSHQIGEDTSNYQNVPPKYFACNLMHVGRDVVLPIAYNHTNITKHVSPAYIVFSLKNNDEILDEFLFIYLKSDERDRFFWFNTDSSVRDGMTWEDFCNVEIEVPDKNIQEKYVNVYLSLVENQKSYENGLDNLKLVCDAYIENLRKKYPIKLKGHLIESNLKNIDRLSTIEKGVSIQKKFIDTKSQSSDITSQKLVKTSYFAFNSNTSRNSDTISIALNNDEDCVVSNTYTVFNCDKHFLPEYLNLWFRRKEFDRFARFNSWGSARETISLTDIEEYIIGDASIEIQKNIVNILNMLETRKKTYDKLGEQIKNICPILIAGAIKEAREA